MGAINGRLRRNRRHRLAAELYATWTPRRLFTFGTSVGGAHWFTDPNTLYRRRNLLRGTENLGNTSYWQLINSATASGTVITLGSTTAYIQALQSGRLTYWPVGTPLTLSATITSSVNQTISVRLTDASDGSPTSAQNMTMVAGVPQSVTLTYTFTSAATFSGQVTILIGYNGSTPVTAGSTLTVQNLQLEEGSVATSYQAVPTTWPEAYLAAVGAENIFAWVDNAGTTPVTAVGDTIGLSLDRAYGGLRVQFSSNDTFASAGTGWVGQTGWSFATGSASVNSALAGTTYMRTAAASVVGMMYEVTFTVSSYTSGSIGIAAGTAVAGLVSAVGTYTRYVTANTTEGVGVYGTSTNTVATLTRVSVRAVPGTHLIQATGTARPTLSARVNALLDTENLAAATWSSIGTAPSVTANAGSAPNGASTATRLQLAAADSRWRHVTTLIAGATYVLSGYIKSNTGGSQSFRFFGADAASVSSNLTATGSWQRFSFTFTNSGSTAAYSNGIRTDSSNTAADLLVWGADLRTADDAAKNIPAYQRVGATAADHDTEGFPHYAEGDGTDNNWITASAVDGSASDQFTVVVGATKNSDAALGAIFETDPAGTGAQALGMFAPVSAGTNIRFRSSGSIAVSGDAQFHSVAAPATRVITGQANIAGDFSLLRLNSVDSASSALDQGTGNYASSTFRVFCRASGTGFLNGRLYSLVFRFGAMGEADRNRLEQWTKNLMRLP